MIRLIIPQTIFFTAPASSTGKYHPACSNQKPGGLLIHVKRACYIGEQLCRANALSPEDADIVRAAIILHDIAKCESYKNYKMFEDHPINAKTYFPQAAVGDKFTKIELCIKYHMGPWTPISIRKTMVDYSLLEWIVYTADYISSDKNITTPIDGENPYGTNI